MFYGTLRLLPRTNFSIGSSGKKSNRIFFFLTRVETRSVSPVFSRCGVCSRALGSSCGAVQVGPWGLSIPDSLGRLPLGENRQVTRSREVSRVSGAPAEGWAGSARTEPQNPLSCRREPSTGKLGEPVAQRGHQLPEIPKGVTVIASTNPGENPKWWHQHLADSPFACHAPLPLEKPIRCSHEHFKGLGFSFSVSNFSF